MTKTFTAVDGSNIYDVCLNTYGTLDYLVKLMVDSNHDGVDTFPVAGQVFTYDDSLTGKISDPSRPTNVSVGSTLLLTKYATQCL